MGNLSNKVSLIHFVVDKNNVNEKSLIDLFNIDEDFTNDDAINICQDIFDIHGSIEDEGERLESMLEEVFSVAGFIGNSSYYGDYEYDVIETEFQFVIAIAVIV